MVVTGTLGSVHCWFATQVVGFQVAGFHYAGFHASPSPAETRAPLPDAVGWTEVLVRSTRMFRAFK